jgi:hypothetical protein
MYSLLYPSILYLKIKCPQSYEVFVKYKNGEYKNVHSPQNYREISVVFWGISLIIDKQTGELLQ